MGRRYSRYIALVCIVLAAPAGLHCAQPEPRNIPDRIILIVVDTLRRENVSAYATAASQAQGDSSVKVADSAPANTPNIDRLANGGQLFNNAISAYHSTTMSMASLFTGHTPSIESGSRENPLDWNTFVAC